MISYERRDNESVDEKSLFKAVSKNYEKRNSGIKGLKDWFYIIVMSMVYSYSLFD